MAHKLVYGTVLEGSHQVIHVLRVLDEILEYREIDEIAHKMRDRMLSKHGAQAAAIVVIQGNSKETLRLFGDSYEVSRVRAAMFNAALNFAPIELD